MPVDVQKAPEIDRTGPESQDTRDQAVAHWEQVLRAGVHQPSFEQTDEPPSGLTDPDRKAWFSRWADALRDQPLPKLSDAARDTMRHGPGSFGGRFDRDQG